MMKIEGYVTDFVQIQLAAREVRALDVLMNNAGTALYDDLTRLDAAEKHLAVNLFGTFNVTRAFLPLLKRSPGAIVNSLSMAAIASFPCALRRRTIQCLVQMHADMESSPRGLPTSISGWNLIERQP
jgi:NAD(P)-dependent dehydrogenase (short-subunit alcohol dehydrogenase family)